MTIAEPLVSFLVQRRADLSRHAEQVGLDYIEVDRAGDAAGHARLRLHFVPRAGGEAEGALPRDLRPGSLRITDAAGEPVLGLRIRAVVYPPGGLPDGDVLFAEVDVDEDTLARASGEIFVLRLVDRPDVDPFFAARRFVLREGLASHAGEALATRRQPATLADAAPVIDYLAKDYASFRQLMFDHLAVLTPTWTQRNPADLGTVLVEVLAYAADSLSYYQDAVATESYLSTARQRVSVRRHARLLGYSLHEGCNARCWVHVEVTADTQLDGGSQLLTRVGSLPAVIQQDSRAYQQAIQTGAQVFETMQPVKLFRAHNEMHFYTWGAREWWLLAGATSATLEGELPNLAAGDVLFFDQMRLTPELEVAPVELPRRHIVRVIGEPRYTRDALTGQAITEITWSAEDALPFDLPVAVVRSAYDARNVSVARGNMILADYGRTVEKEDLPAVSTGLYRPRLLHPDVVHAEVFDPIQARTQSARATLIQDPRLALPSVEVVQHALHPGAAEEDLQWRAQPDLIASNGFARDHVVEVDNHGRAWLRFGDDVLGRKPPPGTRFQASYRVAQGPHGDVDGDSIAHVVADRAEELLIASVRNPLAAEPGQPAEATGAARLYAAELAHQTQTCVTEDDYAQVAASHPRVRAARGRMRWIGRQPVAVLTVQPRAGRAVDAAFAADLAAFMEPHLMVGADVEVQSPAWVPLEIRLVVSIEADQFRSSVERSLSSALGAGPTPDGTPGYFDPDAFTLGQPVYLSPIVARCMQVPGVVSVHWLDERVRFQRWGLPERGELAAGRIDIGPLEVARVHNVPGAPRLGSISFEVRGGRR